MGEFERLLAVTDKLLSPEGCSWDREQNFFTLQPYLLEEVHELIEALDLGDGSHICEELGDVFYNLIFISRVAEKEGLFQLDDALKTIREKLIRRHPHIFGNVKVSSNEEIAANWEKIKQEEKGRTGRFDGIAPTLPSLAKAQKMAHKLRKSGGSKVKEEIVDEEHLGELLWELVKAADKKGIDAESALRRKLNEISASLDPSL